MHDGQMLLMLQNLNKTSWDADDTFGELLKAGKIRDCIIVGIWNVLKSVMQIIFLKKL
jgi:hypothetical protein